MGAQSQWHMKMESGLIHFHSNQNKEKLRITIKRVKQKLKQEMLKLVN